MIKTLLVDDDHAARLTLSALLEDEGFSVIEAATAAEALARIHADVDLVILDQRIGDARGTDLVPHVRASAPRARVVLVSGSDAAEISGGDAFFAKGGRFEELCAILRSLMRG